MSTPTNLDAVAQRFDADRRHLRAVQLPGPVVDPDDAVVANVDNLTGWFAVITAREAVDRLRARERRAEQPPAGPDELVRLAKTVSAPPRPTPPHRKTPRNRRRLCGSVPRRQYRHLARVAVSRRGAQGRADAGSRRCADHIARCQGGGRGDRPIRPARTRRCRGARRRDAGCRASSSPHAGVCKSCCRSGSELIIASTRSTSPPMPNASVGPFWHRRVGHTGNTTASSGTEIERSRAGGPAPWQEREHHAR